MDDLISRQLAIKAACKGFCHPGVRCPDVECREQTKYIRELPAVDAIPIDELLQAGYEGREARFRMRGRLFAIRGVATMNDLISRQAAIDALIAAIKEIGCLDEVDVYGVLTLLPAVQPEEWIYDGNGRPAACPLIEMEVDKT